MYDYLKQNGFLWYEISNWAKEGHECHHNWRYWLRRPYIGLGPSAHSYVPEVRWATVRSVRKYVEALRQGRFPLDFVERLSREEVWREVWMTGLRTRAGVSVDFINSFKGRQNLNLLHDYTKMNLIYLENNNIFITKNGILCSDRLIANIWHALEKV